MSFAHDAFGQPFVFIFHCFSVTCDHFAEADNRANGSFSVRSCVHSLVVELAVVASKIKLFDSKTDGLDRARVHCRNIPSGVQELSSQSRRIANCCHTFQDAGCWLIDQRQFWRFVTELESAKWLCRAHELVHFSSGRFIHVDSFKDLFEFEHLPKQLISSELVWDFRCDLDLPHRSLPSEKCRNYRRKDSSSSGYESLPCVKKANPACAGAVLAFHNTQIDFGSVPNEVQRKQKCDRKQHFKEWFVDFLHAFAP